MRRCSVKSERDMGVAEEKGKEGKAKVDIYNFIESKDIREHLQSLNYQFTAAEAAFLVYQSENRSLPEKFAAWEEIIETMPDCSLPGSGDRMDIPSVHGFLREYVALQRRILNEFYRDGDNAIYTRGSSDAFKNSASALNDTREDSFRYLTKVWFDSKGKYLQVHVNFDQQDNPLYMSHEGVSDGEREESIDDAFRHMCFLFPTPFKRGDIVGNPEDFEDGLYDDLVVLDYLNSWGRDEMMENGFAADDPRVLEADSRVEKMKACGASVDVDLYGYTVRVMGWAAEPRVCYDNFRDYLHYERVNTPLTGFDRVLQPISSHLKGELAPDLLINAVQLIVEETKLERLKKECMNIYTEENLRRAGLGELADRQKRGDAGN